MIVVGMIGVIGCLLGTVLKQLKSEISTYVWLASSIFIMFYCISLFDSVTGVLELLESYTSISSDYIRALLKIIGIAYLSELCASISRDMGNNSVAGQIEMYAKLSMLTLSMPIITALLNLISHMA